MLCPSSAPLSAAVPVRSEVLETASFQPRLMLLGRVEPASRLALRSPAAGRVRYPPRFADGLRTGERIRRGETLFEIDNDELNLRWTEARLTARLAETELERARQGVAGGFLAQAELKQREIDAELANERLANARQQVEKLRLVAPDDGVLRLEQSALPPGSELGAGEAVAELLGDGPLRVEAWALAADRELLRPGLPAECTRAGSETVLGRGVLREVASQVDGAGTLRLVASVGENLEMPLAGEGVELSVLLEPRPAAVTVPEEALIVDGGVATVFVLDPSGAGYRARRRLVVTGSWSDGRVEILDGVSAGERVAVAGAEFLEDGLPAAEAEEDAS